MCMCTATYVDFIFFVLLVIIIFYCLLLLILILYCVLLVIATYCYVLQLVMLLRLYVYHTRTVVRECCKGEDESVWKRGNPRHPKPLNRGHQNLCR